MKNKDIVTKKQLLDFLEQLNDNTLTCKNCICNSSCDSGVWNHNCDEILCLWLNTDVEQSTEQNAKRNKYIAGTVFISNDGECEFEPSNNLGDALKKCIETTKMGVINFSDKEGETNDNN